MNDLHQRVHDLSPEKRQLLEWLLRQDAGNTRAADRLPPTQDARSAPLSFAQQRMWLLDQLEPGNPLYTLPTAMRLTGHLDPTALQRSLSQIVRRHEALRTTFATVDSQPVQRIAPALTMRLPLLDLQQLPSARREAAAARLIAAEARYCFDLASGPLLRTSLLRLNRTKHILLVSMHHIIADGWSIGVFIQELVALYAADVVGTPAQLPALPLQYADFAQQQRQRLSGALLENQLAYWRRQLAGVPILQLPTDHPAPARQSFRSASQPLALTPALTAALKELSQRAGATLFMLLVTGFASLLYRYTGQPDISVGSLVANRNRPEIEGLIGFFVNNLALRIDLAGNPSVRELLRRVRAVTVDAYEHQDVAFEQVVEALVPMRDVSHTPLFQVMCVLQNFPRPSQVLPGLSLRPLRTASRRSGFTLTLWLWEEAGGLAGDLEYNPQLFDPPTITRMIGHMRTLLTSMVAAPAQPIGDLALLSNAERRQVLSDWNDTAVRYPADECLHQLFEAQAARTPDVIALAFDATTTDESAQFVRRSSVVVQLTYRELDRRANQLARQLQARGVRPESCVAIRVERSIELVISLLGVLKAGGAYVPLDPTYPQERLAFMLADSRAVVLITAQDAGRRAQDEETQPESLHGLGLVLDDLCESPAAIVNRQPEIVHPDNLAYVIYTSGSTGRPKGAMNTHRAIVNRLRWMQDAYGLDAADRVLQKTPASFDVSVWEFFWPLSTGARLVLACPGGHQDSGYLVRVIARSQITTLHFVPAMLQVFLEERDLAACRHLRRVICSGEALPVELQDRFFARLPAALHNLYGPTEAAVDVSAWRCLPVPGQRSVPIGRPIANIQLHVLDTQLCPLPIGVPGELFIGGVGLARGYLDRPNLTAERFVPNPFGDCRLQIADCRLDQSTLGYRLSAIGYRLYKTGDRARYRPDGAIEYLGRLDNQIKLRGFRIELGEIETLLHQHADVRECAVLARADVPGDTRLVAYVVTAEDERRRMKDERSDSSSVLRSASFGQELRAFLAERVPEYMVPSAFVLLDALPLLPSGKVDRRGLPAPAAGSPALDAGFVLPRTPLEELLAQLWADVLHLPQVGVADNFFAAGGHSLLATQVIARVRERLQVELLLRDLFEAPTVAGLAARITTAQRGASGGTPPPLQPVPRQGALLPSYAQQRLWLLDQLQPGSPVYTIPATVRLTGVLDVPALQRSLNAIIERHEALRTTFAVMDGQPTQVIGAPQPVTLVRIDLTALPERRREPAALHMATEAVQAPFDLARGPLLHASLLRLGDQAHVALLNMHHIVSDGWSVGVFLNELATLYTAHAHGQPIALPALPVQYADYALWQRTWLQGAVLDAQLGYWRTQLGGELPVLDLPTDQPRPPSCTFRGARESLRLAQSLADALRELSRAEGATLFMTLLAAFKLLMQRYSGQNDIIVGAPIAGRTRAETEGLIGFFVNTLVLRTDLAGAVSFRALLGRVRAVCLGAYAHQELPFEKLLEELQPARDLSHTPLFQVFFNMLNMPYSRSTLPELTVELLAPPEIGAKFDLTLYVEEQADAIQCELVYNADLFEPARMVALLDQLRHLLEQIAGRPDAPLAQVTLVTPATQARLPDPAEALDASWAGAIHSALTERARSTPDQPAVIGPDERWSYAELEARSSRLANALIAGGIAPQDVVAIYAHRSPALVWALLGVLKAGAVFTILDPAYPAARLISYLRLAQPRGWLQLAAAGPPDAELAAYVCDANYCCTLCLPDDAALLARYSSGAPGVKVGPDDLACLAFTSGSTGQPKGILGRHGALTHFLPWHCRTFELRANDRFCMLSGLAHDPLQRDIFTALWLGATICIPDPDQIGAPGWLAGWMQRAAISVAHLTPAMGQLLTATARDDAIMMSLRYAFFIGEVLTRRDVVRLKALAPAITCVSLYGATETQRALSYYVVPDAAFAEPAAGAPRMKEALPLGRGIPDAQLLVLNRAGRLAGIGELGEIAMRSPHLARGYLNRPDLTAERFVPDPFATTNDDTAARPGVLPPSSCVRLYRTGDLGRYRADGIVEFCGRVDQQVKLRGFRIELDEIAQALSEHPAVRDQAVIVRADTPDEQALVAYVVTANDAQHEPSFVRRPASVVPDVRAFLAARLPQYMLPAAFVLLDALPLTPNGKLDRQALPAPDRDLARAGDFALPQTPTEAALAAIWAEVLQMDSVGVNDNFFALGGHSLLATRLVARMRAAFAVELSLRSLFEQPTIAGLARVIAQLRDEQTGAAAAVGALPLIAPDPSQWHQPFPLTDIQHAYWIGRSGAIELGNVATHSYFELDSATLDLDRLTMALRRLIARHPMLRAIVRADGQQQILAQVPPYTIAVLDLRGQPPQVIAERLATERERMSHRVLPSDEWPLFEIRATRLDEQRIRLHIGTDALISDAWSGQILVHELVRLYQNPATPLAPLELSFRDYVLAELALHDSELHRRALAYWAQRLATLPPAPELPLLTNPGAREYTRFVRRQAQLERADWGRLKARAQRAGLTPSGMLLAAFADVLAIWSKQPRFTINLTLFNRLPLHPQVNDIVGDFTSLTPLAITMDDASFEGRARRLQQQLWDDMDHQYVSGVRVLRELARAQGGAPRASMPVVFTSTLIQDSLAQGAPTLDVFGTVVYGISQTPQVWLDHQVIERDGALIFNWDAVEALFPAGLLDAMFGVYCDWLRRLADDAAAWQRAARPGLPPAQRAQHAAVNATAAPIPAGLLHEPFAAQAARRPDEMAVISPTGSLSYSALARRANRVGRWLRAAGARPNTLVAVVMEKGWEQVAAVLGVLMAGAAYLPIDPALPRERLHYLLAHSQVGLVLTQAALDHALVWPAAVRRVWLDHPDVLAEDDRPLAAVQTPHDLAYVIYTSGSTGRPKGVMIDHCGAHNTIYDVNTRFGVGPGDRVLALSALNFDLSVYDIFGVLAAGGTIIMPDPLAARDPAHWSALLTHERVTIWNSVPALLSMLVEYVASSGARLPDALRLVLLSGDWIPVSLPGQLRALGSQAQLISMGGATEASIWSILYPIAAVDAGWASIPYGKPMVNQTFHVLNQRLEPCPIWTPGQLYIGGIGLAQGYFGQPALTAARFVPNPLARPEDEGRMTNDEADAPPFVPGPWSCVRLYKTGDLGRYLPDGSIEFLGREDFQVKVQGHRIELGEIEAVLHAHPAVRATVAAAVGEARGSKRLVAYVVPAETPNAERRTLHGPEWSSSAFSVQRSALVSELRAFLQERLPAYMVPSAFVLLDALPLSANGKIDRQALPAPDEAPATDEATLVAARTPVEELIAGIWAGVLKLERLGVHEDFFALGGDSLLATQVIMRLREAFQRDLPLRMLFELPTVAELATQIAQRRAPADRPPPLQPSPRDRPLPLSSAQQRLWFLDQLEPNNPVYVLPNALRLRGVLSVPALQQTLTRITQRHETLRTTFVFADGQPAQLVGPPRPLALPLVDLQLLPAPQRDATAQRLANREARQPFDLARGPLVRGTLLRLAPAEHVLLLSMHHIISDAWSLGVLIHEVGAIYAACVAGTPPALRELPIQYADYAIWQRQWLQGPLVAAQLAYWRGALAGAPPLLELPTDARPLRESFHGARQAITCAPPVLARLHALSHQTGVTLFMTLLAAFQTLLARYSGQSDLVIGTPIAGRTSAETEGLIGCFVNMLALRTSLAGAPTFRELCRRVREVALGAYDHQDLPFEEVVELLQPTRDLSRHPLFQVMFALQNTPMAALELPELTLAPFALTYEVVRFNLSLVFVETKAGLSGMLGYRTSLFDATTMARVAGHFQTLLHGIIADPDQPLTALPILSAAERHELLVAWNTTWRYPQDRCIQHMFEAQAARTPDAIALVYETPNERRTTKEELSRFIVRPASSGVQLTYRELNRRANRLAHALQARGVGPEVRVGLCMERSPELVIGLLGILKAGGAYVPLDPTYPPARLTFMLEDARVPVLITALKDAGRMTEDEGADSPFGVRRSAFVTRQLVDLTADWASIAAMSAENPASAVTPGNLAYVIYTSGSTGRPKGVLVEHRNLVNLLCASQEQFRFRADDRMPWIASVAFDIALFELFSPLLVGGATVVLPDQRMLDLPRLVAEVARCTLLHTVPSLMRQIVQEIRTHALEQPAYKHIRHAFVGGDVVPPELLSDMQAVFPYATITVLYGPTEATIIGTRYHVPAGQPITRHLIGTPLPNMYVQLYRQGRLVPIGVAGELFIGGAGVTRGYLMRPDLTAERFVPDPFSDCRLQIADCRVADPTISYRPSAIGDRLYRTGDLARWLPDGTLEFLGRIDEQVKVRGYRIELREIELRLRAHPAVRECLVLVRADGLGEQRLVAYVITTNDERPTTNAAEPDPSAVLPPSPVVPELRRFLQAELPEHMLPSAFVLLDTLPLTPNGKLDRDRLPAPDGDRPAQDHAFVAPRTPLERFLAAMWQELLGIAVGVHDNFFALGGNSLQAAVLMNKLHAALGERVYVVAIFDASTVAELADYLTTHYAQAVARIAGAASGHAAVTERADDTQHALIDDTKVAHFRRVIAPLPPRSATAPGATAKNPPAVFILSPPRSGSTLLRVMLAGHPQLFAPPELELLSFNTLAERQAAFAGRDRFWLEGSVRAIMALKSCDAATAARIMAEYEAAGLTVQQFYRLLQTWSGKTLVDKTPSYALDRAILERAEADFAQAKYIHLLRHPYGMIRSFEAARLDQVFFRHPHHFSTRELAELIWLTSHENIRSFLADVPATRQYCVRFEDLLAQPQRTLAGLCAFLGVALHAEMLEPYHETQQRMTDGIHPLSQMLGDVKFHEHRAIDASVAERWKQQGRGDELGAPTWRIAERLGYPRSPDAPALHAAARSSIIAIRQGSQRPFFCVHPASGEVHCYYELAQQLGADQPFYGIRAAGLEPNTTPCDQVEALAAHAIAALRTIQPAGPFLLGGWSLGGVVAFEMAQQLAAQGQSIALLALLDSHLSTRTPDQPDDDLVSLGRFAEDLGLTREYVHGAAAQVRGLDLEGRLGYLLEHARQAGVIPPELTLLQLQRRFAVFQAHGRALQHYVPRRYAQRITLFQAGERSAQAQRAQRQSWRALAGGGLTVYPLPGTHYTLVRPPHVQALAAQVSACLGVAQEAL
jgi:amino acid adenylation domain-containing protein